MAVSPDALIQTVVVGKVKVSASRAAIRKMFGELPLRWKTINALANPTAKRPYGSRQRAAGRAGEPIAVTFGDGETWTYRVSGLQKKFIDLVLAKSEVQILNIVSQRGTEYGPEPEIAL